MSRVLSIDQVADLGWAVGLRGDALAVAIAIAKGESHFDAHAVGDVALQDAKWGPSLGLWQVRSLKQAYLHLEPIRDPAKLKDAAFNAKAMYRISGGGNNWRPWSVYTSGAYRNHLAAARRAAKRRADQGGTGSVSGGGGSTDVPTGSTPDIAVPSGSLPLNYREPRRIDTLYVRGISESGYIGDYVTGGHVDLTATQVSEVRLDLINPDLMFHGAGRNFVAPGGMLLWDGLKMLVAAAEIRAGHGDPNLQVTCRSVGAEMLKAAGSVYHDSIRAEGVKNISPTDYAHRMQKQFAGQFLTFVGEGSAVRSDIAPLRNPDGELETPWETIQRLAAETGFVCFEAADTLYFASPTWLAGRGVEVKVGWRNSWGDDRLDALEMPKIRKTNYRDEPATLTCVLPRWRGEQVRPGYRIALKGIYGVPQVWLVTKVAWPIDGGIDPVTIEAAEPVNPTPTLAPEASSSGGSSSDGGGSSGTATASPGAKGVRITDAQRITHFGQPGDAGRITTYKTPWGITVSVHREVKDRFAQACDEAATKSSWRPRRIDSLAVRKIRGGSSWSLHSWAIAWDFFATGPGVPPPGGVWTPDNAVDEAFGQVFEKYGFTWGKRWDRQDIPHIEWADYPPNATKGRDDREQRPWAN